MTIPDAPKKLGKLRKSEGAQKVEDQYMHDCKAAGVVLRKKYTTSAKRHRAAR